MVGTENMADDRSEYAATASEPARELVRGALVWDMTLPWSDDYADALMLAS